MASKGAKPTPSGGKRPTAKDSKDVKKGAPKTAASKGPTPEELEQKERERIEKEHEQAEKERLEAEEEMKRQMSEEQLQAYEEQKAREKAEQEMVEREAAEKKAAEIRVDINAKIVELQRNCFIADVYRFELDKVLAV
jgi:vacuolar-type H+-ATPase subunit I/STV1